MPTYLLALRLRVAAAGIVAAVLVDVGMAQQGREPAGASLRLIAAPPQTIERVPVPISPGEPPRAPRVFPIDLPTALKLAEADNLQVAIAREQIRQAYAGLTQADALWLPSLRGGLHWNKHEGPLQDTVGNILDVSRASLYYGAGAQAIGAGSPMVPGVWANFHLADALFQPLAARQRVGDRRTAASATRNNVLLEVALAYLELLRAAEDLAVAGEAQAKVLELSAITDAFARTGQGLRSDAERVQVELSLRENDLRRAEESQAVASARLAQLVRLDPCVQLQPIEPAVVPLELLPQNPECCELVAQGLSNRPELAQMRYLVGEAVARLRRERYAPLVPSLMLGASYGGFGGGRGDTIADVNDRFDFDATAYWEIRNLGVGEEAARSGAQSQVRQAQLRQMAMLDLVAREVVEAHAQVQFRRRQVDTARRAVQQAYASHEHNLARIRNAQGLPIEVLQSTQALLQARREYLQSTIDYNAAQFTLQRALGWPVR